MRVSRVAALLLCLCAAAAVWAEADEPEGWDVNVGQGPLSLRDQFLLSQPHLSLTPQDPRPTDKGRWRVGMDLDWANTFGQKGVSYLVDGETVTTQPYVRYGLLEGLEVGLDVPIFWRGGGAMDGFIQDFHDAFGVGQNGREVIPDDSFTAFINQGGNFYQIDDEGWGLGNVALSSKLTLAQGDERWPAFAVQATLTVPTGDQSREFTQGGWDGGLVASVSKGFCGKFYVYGNAGFTAYSDDHQGPIQLETARGFFMGGLEYRCSKSCSIVLQATFTSPYFAADHLHNWTYIAGLGPKFQIGENCKAEFGVLENFGGYDLSADFGLHFGVEFGF